MNRQLPKIIKKCLKNDRKAQFDLYHLCYDHLMRTCNRYKRNREDAVALLNDGFLKVLLNLESYDVNQEFFPWISTIMVRTAIDDFRKHKTYQKETDFKETDAELEKASSNNGQLDLVNQLSADDIKELIFGLPEKERLVFTLYEMEGYKHQEIAKQLEVTERSTKRYLKNAKTLLRSALEKKTDLKKVI
jgi:RNA polymerase sigma-70 factor (ECF subfamily)